MEPREESCQSTEHGYDNIATVTTTEHMHLHTVELNTVLSIL